jgi:son of sevenless-like protein
MINFDKRRKIAVVIREIQQYQQQPYMFQEIEVLQTYLRNVRWTDAESLYQASLQIEPMIEEDWDETLM